jgi:hypothetical protein
MPNRSTRDDMQNRMTKQTMVQPNDGTPAYRPNPDGTRQVSPPTRSAFDPAPTVAKAGPVAAPPAPTSADGQMGTDGTPATGPGVSVIKAANTLANRGKVIDQAVVDAGG